MGNQESTQQKARLKGQPDVGRRRVGLQPQRAQVDAGVTQKTWVAEGVRVQHPHPQLVQRLRMQPRVPSLRMSYRMQPSGHIVIIA